MSSSRSHPRPHERPDSFCSGESRIDPTRIFYHTFAWLEAAADPGAYGFVKSAQQVVEIQFETRFGKHAHLDGRKQTQRLMARDGTIVAESGVVGIRGPIKFYRSLDLDIHRLNAFIQFRRRCVVTQGWFDRADGFSGKAGARQQYFVNGVSPIPPGAAAKGSIMWPDQILPSRFESCAAAVCSQSDADSRTLKR